MLDHCERSVTDEFENEGCSHSVVQFEITDAADVEDVEAEYDSTISLFGPARYETGELQIVYIDGTGCDPYNVSTKDVMGNAVDAKGKIIIVDRGSCYFTVKHRNAQDAGAAALLIANYEGATKIYMAHSDTE